MSLPEVLALLITVYEIRGKKIFSLVTRPKCIFTAAKVLIEDINQNLKGSFVCVCVALGYPTYNRTNISFVGG